MSEDKSDKPIRPYTERQRLPVLPLREVVLFPGVTAPIGAGRPGTLRAIEAALKSDDRLIFAVCQRENSDSVEPAGLFTTGTVAKIGQIQRGLGGVQLLLHGEHRASVMQYSEVDGYIESVVCQAPDLPPIDEEDAAFVALHREVRERAGELGQKAGLAEDVVEQVLAGVKEPGQFADLVAGYLDISPKNRQELLEMLGVEERLRRVLVHVQRQIELLDAQEDIKSKVQEELGERQREIFLREQLKAIRQELGDDEEGETVDDLRETLAELDLPEEARKEVNRELSRLGRAPRESMESQVIRTFLETVAELPWSKRSEDHLDLKRALEILDDDHYGLRDVKDRVLEFLAVRQLRDARSRDEGDAESAPGNEDDRIGVGSILLFVGPPGVGKTSIAKSIARAMGREYVRISLGGARDEADIRGHRRTYVGALPGRIIQGMKKAGTKNPVFLLDEVDKLGVSFQGDPAAALLEVLDPAQNDSFTDHYLGMPYDLSEVFFIATANFLENIPAPLLDRMEMVEFSGYTEQEKLAIARRYLVPRQIQTAGLVTDLLHFGDGAVSKIISSYTREAGVRQLEREIGRVARKAARQIASGDSDKVDVEPDGVGDWLGRPRVHPERAAQEDQVGISTGMYYTPIGGDIMFVEASIMRGQGELVLTGQLGDVMKESARAGLTYAKTHCDELGIPAERFENKDVHIHVPAGAVPKEGSSAGITMATALISALAKVPARADVAMTGEVTLSGRVLPIGGVKEKVLGALRAGIDTIVLPKDNVADLDDIREEDRKRLTVHSVEHLGEVLDIALKRPARQDDRELKESGDFVLSTS